MIWRAITPYYLRQECYFVLDVCLSVCMFLYHRQFYHRRTCILLYVDKETDKILEMIYLPLDVDLEILKD